MFNSIIEAILHHADTQPDKLCLADDKGTVTYAEYASLILRFANALDTLGVGRGQSVVVEACQTIDYLATQQAIQLLGGVFVPTEHNCAPDKIVGFAERADAGLVITEKAVIEGAITFETLHEKGVDKYAYTELPKREDVCEILFSTGTTGKEKGIVLTHKNNVALAENVMYGVEMEKDNVEMIPSPMNHSHGLRRYYANMYNGSTVVLLGSVMDILRFFKNIDTYGVNSMDLVPTALTVVLKLSKGKLAEYSDRLRYIQLGAAPLMEQDKLKICELLPNTRLYNFYGSTESGCTCIYNFNIPNAKDKCIGKPSHNTRLLIVDDDRREIISDKDHTGLLATAGGMNMTGYFKDEEETAAAMADGIVYSNDIGYVDEDGDVILLGRKGDVINVGGNKVSPDEIENAAKLMADIADCGCIPVPDSAKGSVPKLFVQMKKGRSFDGKEIRAFLASKLEPYKVPQYIEEIAEIPRSYNGKLLRKNLKELG